MPMKKEHRYATCMSTPHGTKQWTVQVMGLRNAGAQFQRMMEWVLTDHPSADPYLDDVVIGSTGETMEEAIQNNYKEVRKVLADAKNFQMVYKPTSEVFQKEVIFCGHILRENRRSPAPGKLAPIQFWERPDTVTGLRAFLGLTNYFAEYVHHYADLAAPLSNKLCLNRKDGKKGSKMKLIWTPEEDTAFKEMKKRLGETLEVWQVDLDKPFRLRCDASGYAIGAELAQEIEGSWRTVGLFSRKLGKSQLNWTPREKETYAIVAALQKWAGTIGFQPVTVTTDHRALESWVTEHVDTPSGPRGRRARWHETLSQFDLEVKYIPGPENTVADALSRWAYPASSAREDVSFHGSAQAKEEVDKIIKEEQTLARMVGVLRRRRPAHEEKEREESSKGQEGKVGNPPDHAWQSKEEKGIRKGYPVSQGLPESAGRGHQEGQEEPEGEGGPEEAAPAAGPQPDQKSYPITQPCPVWRADTRGRREKGETPQQVSPITLRSGRRTQEEENEEGGTPQQLTTPEKGGFLHRKGEPNPRPKFTFSRRRGKVGGAPTEEVNRNPEEASSSTQLPRMVTRRGGSPPPERREPDGPHPVIPPHPWSSTHI